MKVDPAPSAESTRISPPWRDTMVRVCGPVVSSIQGVFVENWVECCGEILCGPEYFPQLSKCGHTSAMVIKSSPADRATACRVAFQMLIESATRQIRVTTPYFLPDRSLRHAGRARRGPHAPDGWRDPTRAGDGRARARRTRSAPGRRTRHRAARTLAARPWPPTCTPPWPRRAVRSISRRVSSIRSRSSRMWASRFSSSDRLRV